MHSVHIWHHRLKNRAVSFCPINHFAPVSPISADIRSESRFTAPLARRVKTKFPTVHPTIYLPK